MTTVEPIAVPQLRPLGIGEILDVGIKITTRHWKTLVLAVLVVVVPLELLGALVTLSAADTSVYDPLTNEFDQDVLWREIAAIALAAGLTLLAQTIATGACFKTVADAYLGRSASWRRSLGEVARRLHSILWITFLASFLAILALLACIAPGIWLYFAWAVAIPVLLMEGTKGRRALGRSFRLVRGFWWRTFAILVLGAILAGIVQSAVTAAFLAVTFSTNSEAVSILANFLASVVAGMLTTPFVAAVTIVLYIDLRVRKEGFDLALLAARLGGDGEPMADTPLADIPAPPPVLPAARPPTGGAQPPYWPPPPGWKPSDPDS
ncbi:MAG: hypothetical protein M3364_08505 [Actinomycetota bacterium]|nr:hypothetical protein [Actinomycetota bacterium]